MGVRNAEIVELVKLEDGKDENLRLGMGWGLYKGRKVSLAGEIFPRP